jgi:uncharacterized protein YwgA
MERMTKSTDTNRIVWLVGNHSRIEGRTRFQKIVYLLKVEHEIEFSFDFTPYYYGPYSDDLSEYIEDLVSYGLLVEKRTRLFGDVNRYDYELTEKGEKLFETMRENTIPTDMKRIAKFVTSNLNTATPKLVGKAKSIMTSKAAS